MHPTALASLQCGDLGRGIEADPCLPIRLGHRGTGGAERLSRGRGRGGGRRRQAREDADCPRDPWAGTR
ncbi:hypothetical protein JZ751_019771 [Albula glossodonta]|uniref:Uncharacterized protein n=1 Tax=Albula glossodonta TaxID=121402 RepID=A0A8T2NU24_9TELE|nr:hypothetical protein JZ751_019771 [Albula glossodonta]